MENFLLTPKFLATALRNANVKRSKYTGREGAVPTEEEIESKLDEILEESEIRETVKYQVLPKYRESLDRSLDPSTKERQCEEWFEDRWQDRTWRINHCPGKRVLAKLRDWSQANYGLTPTSGELTRALTECPAEVAEIARCLEQHFYAASASV